MIVEPFSVGGPRMVDNDNVEQQIENEVQRRVGAQMRRHHAEVANLHGIIKDCQNTLVAQHHRIKGLSQIPYTFGQLIRVWPYPDPAVFKSNDEVIVVDIESPHHLSGGRIVSGLNEGPVVNDNGYIIVQLTEEIEERFSIGLEGKDPAQVRLTTKEDGTSAVVKIDGKAWEVAGVPDLDVGVGDTVKVNPETKAIISGAQALDNGPICKVSAVSEEGVEVLNKGEVVFVYNPRAFELEEGDRVVCDKDLFCILRKLERDARDRYKVSADLNVTWDDVGGLAVAKQELQEVLELPFQHPDLFKYYNIDPLRGVLLCGPPGCGKTLLARVSVWSLAQIHGRDVVETAYIFVKGPEILDKWVGNTEAEIRELFERGRRHYRMFGYKAILAIDEADAILPQRGTRRSSDIADTIVPMFLGEMDGIDDQQTIENPIVYLMSNRPDILDPAVTRPGRIDKHIKIGRPDEMTGIDILDIHSRKLPFQNDNDRMATLAVASADIFSKSRLLYRVNGEHDFTLGDAVNGAMLANLAQTAAMTALHRDLLSGTQTGIITEDFRDGVQKIFRQQRHLNHNYDLQDFADGLGIQPQNLQVDRCFGAA
jgi:proteasome-associated ATPase